MKYTSFFLIICCMLQISLHGAEMFQKTTENPKSSSIRKVVILNVGTFLYKFHPDSKVERAQLKNNNKYSEFNAQPLRNHNFIFQEPNGSERLCELDANGYILDITSVDSDKLKRVVIPEIGTFLYKFLEDGTVERAQLLTDGTYSVFSSDPLRNKSFSVPQGVGRIVYDVDAEGLIIKTTEVGSILKPNEKSPE